MRMPFGKHKGLEIEDLPDGYLMWLYEQAELREGYLKRCVEEEYHARFGGGPHQEKFYEDFFGHAGNSGRGAGMSALEKLAQEQPKLFLEVAEAGYRQMAKKYHSDVGGSDDIMRQLNALIEKVRQHLRSKV